ncbi:DUF6924 domain-containing protein [Nocardia jiangxiensis]|uniref:DUF6924 domain-containing protein n=1 Tax=Nocardia jiangxiensis TaxID=282685 RepID=A0ABW6SEC2_9NOCA|nr:hypothetical protein [Nocardia jiangxiensis]
MNSHDVDNDSTTAQSAFEDSAPVARITPERPLHRRNDSGEVTHRIERSPDGSLRGAEKNMSYLVATAALAQWMEQDGAVLTWLPRPEDGEFAVCLLDVDGNMLWRTRSEAWTEVPPPARPHDHNGPALGAGSRLRRQSLTSPSGSHTLLHHDNGDLVLYCNATHTAVWATGTDWIGDGWLDLTLDGDLVLRTSCGASVWRSGTADRGVAQLTVQDDGALALLDAAGTAVWQIGDHAPCTGTGHTPPRGEMLRRGQTLRGQSLTSVDGGAVLSQQPGNGIRLFEPDGYQAWVSDSVRKAAELALDDDGFLRVRDAQGAVLEELGGPADHLVVVPGGEIRLRTDAGEVLWRAGRYVFDGPDAIPVAPARPLTPAALEAVFNTRSTPIVRTDFSDDDAWERAWRDITRLRKYWDDEVVLDGTLVALPEFDGWTGADLATMLSEVDMHAVVLTVDAVTLASPEHPVLVTELDPEPAEKQDEPRSFRATPHALLDAVLQLSIANFDWEDFSESVDEDGILRTSTAD